VERASSDPASSKPRSVADIASRSSTAARTNAELFPECEKLRGDRDGDQSALSGRSFDVVIDTWTDTPRHVRSAVEILGPHVAQYVFVSSLNAVADLSRPGLDESAPMTTLDPQFEDSTEPMHFGGRKARCETLLAERMPGRATVLRPGLIVGPRDGSDRFTYWPVRVARGGEVLAPGSGDDPTQFIDARDLGEFTVRLCEERTMGLFHVVGPRERLTMRTLLETCRRVSKSDARLTWVDTRFLLEQHVAPWTDLPAWLPSLEEGDAFWTLDIRKALAAGLSSRPLETTVRDTLEWWSTLPEERRATLKRGLSPEREEQLLAAWHRQA
jgi:2'-hydroxyisoflavone reductase